MKTKIIFTCVLLLTLLLAACAQPEQATSEATQASDQPTAYPGPDQPIDSSYPAVEEAPVELQPTWTIDPSFSQVKGRLLVNGKPAARINLFLGGVITDANGLEIIASLDQKKDPTCQIDEKGNFNFVNVPPGRYALILDFGTAAFLLTEPNGTNAMLLTVGTDVIDLGTLDYKDFPIPVE